MHSAKGLEFPSVFVVGMEDGLFPGNRAMGEPEEMEEERRLCYVAMTRAKERLTMTTARQRMLYGRTSNNMPSRFLEEIPSETCQWQNKREPRPQWDEGREFGSFGGESFSGYGYGQRSQARREASSPRPYHSSAAGRSAVGRTEKAPPAPLLQLAAGDRIRHKSFGEGLVVSLKPMGGDVLMEVAFDQVGTKRLMLKVAGAHITKL